MPPVSDLDGRFTLRLARSMQGLAGLAAWVDAVSAALRLPPPQDYALRLCLEEAVANVVMHGRSSPDSPGETILVGLSEMQNTLCVTVEDDCAPFDPLLQPAPDLRRSLEEEPGGWGIQLMRQYAASLQYQRVDGINRLALTIGRQGH